MGQNHTHDWTPERKAEAKRLFLHEGRSCSEVARQLGGGISRNAVMGMLARMGVKRDQGGEAQKLGGRAARGLLPSASERRASGGALTRKLIAKAPDPTGLPEWRDDGVAEGVLLADLKAGQCKWPLGSLLAPAHRFCAEPTRDADCPYCAAHARRAFAKMDAAKVKKSNEQAIRLQARSR